MTISSGASEITDDLTAESRPILAPARPAWLGSWLRAPLGPWRGPRRVAAWYALFALYAGGVAAFSGPGNDRAWGIWAAFGYAAATALAAARPTRAGRAAALATAAVGALAAPLAWLALTAPATPDTAVVTRSGALLLAHGTPYLAPAALAHGGWLAYDPYLPVMALFGLPRALGWPGLAGDPRPWLAAATFLILAAAFGAAPVPPPPPAPAPPPRQRAAAERWGWPRSPPPPRCWPSRWPWALPTPRSSP